MPTYGTPIDYDPFAVKPKPEEKPKAGVLRTIGDAAIGVGQGAIGALKSGADLAAIAGLADVNNGVSEGGRKASAVLEGFKSQALLDEKAAAQKRIDEAEGGLAKFGEAASSYLTNPRLALDMTAENAAMLVPSAAAGRFAGKTAQALGAAESLAGKAGVGAAIGTGAAQQATDVSRGAYDSAIADGATPSQAMSAARAAFAPAAAISVGAQFLPGGQSIERALAGGAARNMIKGGVMNRVYAGLKDATGEGVSEAIEEGGGQAAANFAQQQFSNPNKDIWDGVAENAGQGLAGGVLLGGPAGLASGTEIAPTANTAVQSDAAQTAAQGVGAAPATAPNPAATAQPPTTAQSAPTVVVDPNAGVLSRGIAEMNGGDAVTPVAVPVPQAAPEQSSAENVPDKQAQKEEKQAERAAFVDDAIDNQIATSGEVSKEALSALQITPSEVREGVQRQVQDSTIAKDAADARAQIEQTRQGFEQGIARERTKGVFENDSAFLSRVQESLRSGTINRKAIAQEFGASIADVSNVVKEARKLSFEAEQAQAKSALESESAFAQQAANSPSVKVDERAAQASGSQGDAIAPQAPINPPVNEVSNEDESANSNAGEPIGLRQTISSNDANQAEQAPSPTENSNGIQGTTQEVEAEPKAASAELQPEQTPGLTDAPVYSDSTEVLDDDITSPSGPYSTKQNAEFNARRVDGGKVFEVDGGYVVRTPTRAAPSTSVVPATTAPAPAEVQTAPASIPDAPRTQDAPIAANNAQPLQQPTPKAKAEVRAPRRYSPEELDGKIVYERLFDPQGNRLIHTGPLSTHKGQKPAAQFIKENDSLTESYEALLKCLRSGN